MCADEFERKYPGLV